MRRVAELSIAGNIMFIHALVVPVIWIPDFINAISTPMSQHKLF